VTSSNTDGIQIRRNSVLASDYALLGFRTNTTEGGNFAEIRGLRTNRVAGGDSDLRFATWSNGVLSEKMSVRDDGNVGIGTSTPDSRLRIEQSSGTIPVLITNMPSSTPDSFPMVEIKRNGTNQFSVEGNGTIKANAMMLNSTSLQDTATVTTTSTTQTVLATYAVATYATGKFMIQATRGTARHISELLVTHDGTTSTATEYGIVRTGDSLFNVTTDISGGNVRLLVTSTSATSTVYRTTFTLLGV
jgi:hypothetical protein